mmetsp:Transcript_22650/g.44442  ORF Transcript_22650/g.44442 Transcript_22650/m.44442 type:complete len:149 (+) Transcript_22650:242-688(+)
MRECDLSTWAAMRLSGNNSADGGEDNPIEMVCLLERNDPVCIFLQNQLRQVQEEAQLTQVTTILEDDFLECDQQLLQELGACAFPTTLLLCKGKPVRVLRQGYRESKAIVGPVSTNDLVDFIRHAREKLVYSSSDFETMLTEAIPLSF